MRAEYQSVVSLFAFRLIHYATKVYKLFNITNFSEKIFHRQPPNREDIPPVVPPYSPPSTVSIRIQEPLVIESKRPERQNIEVSVLDVIFDYECILSAFDLFLLFGLSAYFESMATYKKICNRRSSNLIVDT